MIPIVGIYASSPDGAVIVFNGLSIRKRLLGRRRCRWKMSHGTQMLKSNVRAFKRDGSVNSPEEMTEIIRKKWKNAAAYYMVQIHQKWQHKSQRNAFCGMDTPIDANVAHTLRSFFLESLSEVLENFRLKNVPLKSCSQKSKP